jgi:TM2 domain-containing membrane protein YozV
MKTNKFSLLILSAFIVILSSCSVEKRTHLSGYHIDWKNKNENSVKRIKQQNNAIGLEQSENIALNNDTDNVLNEEANVSASVDALPIIINKMKSEVAKAVKKTTSYKAAEIENQVVVKNDAKESVKNYSFEKKQVAAKPNDRVRNQIVAALLAFFLGGLGIHRFFLGYTGIGIAQLLMFVLGIPLMAILIGIPIVLAAYIWVLIDFVRILTGDLKPKDGSYS